MKNSKSAKYLNPKSAKRRLFYWLLIFFIAIAVPVYFLLDKVYSQLENENWYRQRNQAELLVERIEQQLLDKLQVEQDRPIAEYSFFNVLENSLLQSSTLNFSPLSELPPKSDIPGLVGYFQIDSNGVFHIPALPELNSDLQTGLSAESLAERVALKTQLRGLLEVESETNKDQLLSAASNQQDKDAAPPVMAQRNRFDDYFSSSSQERDELSSFGRITAKVQVEKKRSPAGISKKTQSLSEEKLQQLNIETSVWKQKNKSNSRSSDKKKKYDTEYRQQARKETVNIPDQSSARAIFKRSPAPQVLADYAMQESESDLAEALPAEPVKNEKIAPKNQLPVDILSFESEVSPLQMMTLNNGHLCFYRNVWNAKSRYIQGFIVNQHFLQTLIQPTVASANNLSLSSLILVDQGNILQQFNLITGNPEMLIFRRSLRPPFQQMEVLVNSGILAVDAGERILDMLSIALGLIISIGFLWLYRLGAGQINLAQQQRNFISSVSHELKTPLTSIRMYSEMLRADWVPDESRKQSYYDYIYFESERLSRLITNVLQLAKLDNDQGKAKLVAVNIQQLMYKVEAKVAAQIEASHYVANLIVPAQNLIDAELKVDEDAFFQIMINLVDNAIKFSQQAENKSIDIGYKTTDRGKKVIFFVRDYGSGVDKAQMKKIFQLFYRAGDELTRTQPGTGIGLALVVQLAESMGAKVDLVNRTPGAEFQLKFSL